MGQLGMLKRLAEIWPGAPFFGWAVLVWTMLAHASTAQFTFTLADSVSKWLGDNAWVGFIVGFCILAGAVFWPDIEPKIRWIGIPKSPGARLAAIESEHHQRLEALEGTVTDLVTPVMLTEQLNAVLQRALVIERANTDRIVAFGNRLSNCDSRLLTQAGCLQKIAHIGLWMDDVSTRMHEAGVCHFMLSEIRRRYPESDIGKQPLSGNWKPASNIEPKDEPTRLGLMFVAYLKRHIDLCLAMPDNPAINSGKSTQELCTYMSVPYSVDASGETCLRLLDEHQKELNSIRSAQAANFADPTLSPRIS
jgi:hypothetical protein